MRQVAVLSRLIWMVTVGCAPQDQRDDGKERILAASEVRTSPADEAAIRAGYRERLRLGLGSPFRLIDFALADPRLRPDTRRSIAEDLLREVTDGDLYEIDVTVLAPAEPAATDPLGRANRHLDLIESVIEAADNPRAGELTIRLAYQLAALEGTTDQRLPAAAAAVASLLRDRVLARDDARALRRAARAAGVQPLDLVPEWRRERRFAVERPPVHRIPEFQEGRVVNAAVGVLPLLRHSELAEIAAGPTAAHVVRDLGGLRALRIIADSMGMPPRVPVVMAIWRANFALPESLDGESRLGWGEFAAEPWSEEQFVSRHALAMQRYPALRTTLAVVAVAAAVGMRAYAQEAVWYPGSPAPSPAELVQSYGVRVRVAPDIPDRWVPYYLYAFRESLEDLKRVIPTLAVFGLTLEINSISRHPRALASHNIASRGVRVLELPVATGLGTLAHEIGHDLDWQAGSRTPGPRLRASTLVAEFGPFSLASALEELTPAGSGEETAIQMDTSHATRPVEVLARAFEWFVVSRLAARGIWNGALSSAQDELFTGHTNLGPPGVRPGYAPAVVEVMRILGDTPVIERAAFMNDYGPYRWPTAGALLRSLRERLERLSVAQPEEFPGTPGLLLRRLAELKQDELALLERPACAVWSPLDSEARRAAHRRLVVQAIAARGRALAFEFAERSAGDAGRRWMKRALFGPLWPVVAMDPSTLAVLSPIVSEVKELEKIPTPPLAVPPLWAAEPTGCSILAPAFRRPVM